MKLREKPPQSINTLREMNSSQVLNKLTIICLQRLTTKSKCGETKGSEFECKIIADSKKKKNYFT